MPRFSSKRRVRHTAPQMFDLVADVERYPEFVPLCQALKIRQRTPKDDGTEIVVADMTVSFKLVRETFTSKVTLDRPNLKILVEYLARPVQQSGEPLELRAEVGDRMRCRLLPGLRIQESDAGDADGLDVRRRIRTLCACFREAGRPDLRQAAAVNVSALVAKRAAMRPRRSAGAPMRQYRSSLAKANEDSTRIAAPITVSALCGVP